MADTQKVEVIRSFYMDNRLIEKGRKMDLPVRFAKEMIHCKKVVGITSSGEPVPLTGAAAQTKGAAGSGKATLTTNSVGGKG